MILPIESNSIAWCRDITKAFDGLIALSGVTLKVMPHEVVGLIGANGSGKTTLFDVLGAFVRPDAGECRVMERSVIGRHPAAVAKLGVARAFQTPILVKRLTVAEHLRLAGADETVDDSLLSAELLGRRGSELSYGEQKLVALACCIRRQSRLLLLDEPLVGLSMRHVDIACAAVRNVSSGECAIVVVEHDLSTLRRIATRIIGLKHGQIVFDSDPAELTSDAVRRIYAN